MIVANLGKMLAMVSPKNGDPSVILFGDDELTVTTEGTDAFRMETPIYTRYMIISCSPFSYTVSN